MCTLINAILNLNGIVKYLILNFCKVNNYQNHNILKIANTSSNKQYYTKRIILFLSYKTLDLLSFNFWRQRILYFLLMNIQHNIKDVKNIQAKNLTLICKIWSLTFSLVIIIFFFNLRFVAFSVGRIIETFHEFHSF